MSRNHRIGSAHSFCQLFRSLVTPKSSRRRIAAKRAGTKYSGASPEALEERTLLAGINDDPSNPAWNVVLDNDAEQDVRDLIDALSDVANHADSGATTNQLTTIDSSLKALLDAGGTSVIQNSLNLTQPVSDLFASNSNVSIHDLAVTIDNAIAPFGGHVDVDLTAVGTATTNDLDLQIVVNHSVDASIDVEIDTNQFGSAGESLKLEGNATVDIATSLAADISLTVDLDSTARNEGVLELDNLQISAGLIDAAVDTQATYHFAELTSVGTSTGSASVDISLTDPTPAAPGLTLSELNASGSNQINEVKASSLSITLPMTTDLTEFSAAGGATPAIALEESDLFNADVSLSGTLNDFEAFDPFTQMSTAQFQAALEAVTAVFEEVDGSNLLAADIVLTNGQTLQQLVDVSDVFTHKLLAGLINPGSLELAVSSNIAHWQAITDGAFSVSIDGEVVRLTGLNFLAAADMNDVAATLQTALNNATQSAGDVTAVFDAATIRTDTDENTTTVATLTITSSGLTSAAQISSPDVVTVTVTDANGNESQQIIGTPLFGGVIPIDGAVATAPTTKYTNAQEFRDLIKALTDNAVSDVIFVPAAGHQPAGLKFAFNATQAYDQVSRDLNLDLPTDVLTDIQTEEQIELTAKIAAAGTITVGLTPISGSFELQPSTLLSSLNASQGVMLNRDSEGDPAADGKTDIKVTLRDGTSFEVNFDNATTIQHVLDAFNNSTINGGKATLSIAADKLRLQAADHTSGNTLLQVAAINGSLAAFSLGITGTAAAEDDANTDDSEATTISGAALHGLSVSDHVHLSDVSIKPEVHLEAQSIDATGRLGAISIDLDKEGDESAIEGLFSQHVTFGSDDQSAADLLQKINGDSSPATSTVESDVDLHWGIDVSGSLRDRVAHENSRADGTVIVSAGTELGAYQADGPNVMLTISDARELQDVSAVNLQDLSNLLDDAARVIGNLGVLKKDLPLIKKSVSELVNVEKELLKLTPKLKPHLTGALQNVEGIIADALKLNSTDASPVRPKVTLSLDRSEVQEGASSSVGDVALRLDIDVSFSAANLDSVRQFDADPFTPGLQVPIDFDAKALGLDLPNLIDASGEALITVDVGTSLRLSVGLQLTGDNKGQTFLYDKTQNGTRLTTDLTAKAEDISFQASVGPFGASINGGKLAITGSDPFSADFDLEQLDAATYGVNIIGGGEDGRVTIAEAKQDNNAIAENGVTAYAFANLPTFFPTPANNLGSFELKADLPLFNEYRDDATGFAATTPEDGGVAVSKGDQSVYTAKTPTFNVDDIDLGSNMLALMGGWNGVFDVIIGAMRGEVLGVDIPLIGDALEDQARFLEVIRDNVVDSFVVSENGNPTLDMIKATFFSALGPAGANMLTDGNNDGVITVDDVKITESYNSLQILDDVKFELPLGQKTVLDEKIAFDLGLPGIGLDVDGGVQLEADWSFDLAIGLNTSDGVYVDTSSDSEIELAVTATLPNFAAKGKVGVLQVDVTDDVESPTKAEASFVIDLRDVEDGDDNNNLTFGEIRNADSSEIIGATLTADVGVHVDLMASFSGSANFPRLRSEFVVDWNYTKGLGATADQTTDIGAPTVAFNNVGLNLGEFITNFVKPLAEQVKQVTDPVQPILDAIHSPVPVVSNIIGHVTWLDLAAMYGGADVKPYIDAIETVEDFIALTNTLSGITNDTWIEAGSFTLAGDQALNGTPGNVDTESRTEPEKTVDEQLAEHGAEGLTSAKKEKVIKIPLLKKPANALGLFTGKVVDLVLFDVPALELDFNMARRVPFPPFPALYAELGGGVSSKIDFNFGYDSSGLQQFVSTLNPADIANGLFISDRENLDGTGRDVPEAIFKGYLYVQGGLDAGIFEAGVRGQISSTVNFDLHDYPDEFTNETDGKIRVDEIWRSLQLNPAPLHVFDVSGSVDAGLSAFWKIDLLFSSIHRSYNIASTRLLNFRVHRPAEARDLIATKTGGTLTLNATSGNDHFVVLPGNDANDPNRVVVRTLNSDGDILETKGFAGITEIVADGGDGNDTIKIDLRLTQPVTLHGGAGNDTLTAGGGPATLNGDDGDDELFGTAHADKLYGGAGNDTLHGYAGDDILSGNSGDDTLFGGKGEDNLRGFAGNDTLYGEEGRDILHGHSGTDILHGGRGDDRLLGGGDSDTLYGEEGRDYIQGGTGDDELYGGPLSDILIGGAGDDEIDGGSANDTIYGNAIGNVQIAPGLYNDTGDGNNTIVGGAGSDLISTGSGNDDIYAGTYSDGEGYTPGEDLAHTIHSTGGDNRILGDLGDDDVTTGGGSDHIETFAGEDVIIAGSGNDHINAGSDNDTVQAPGGDNTIFGGRGIDMIVTGPGIDAINGDGGADVIISGAGNDTVNSGDGDDIVIGGFGNDSINSGSGRDIVWGGLLPATLSGIAPSATTTEERLPQTLAALDGSLGQRVIDWARDAVNPTDWDEAEAANVTGFDVPQIMPRALNGLSVEGTSYDGDDTIDGGTGDDVIFAGSDHDTVRGGSGDDFIDAGAGDDNVFGGEGRDVLMGGANNDRVFGNAGIDQLYGGFGDDVLYAGAGDIEPTSNVHKLSGQRSWGGAGVDYLYAFAAVGNFVDATAIQNELTLAGDEMHGGSGGDFLYGNLRAEVLSGGDGNDTLLGDWLAGAAVGEDGLPGQNNNKAKLGGNDLLIGGSGEDDLSGGGGNDRLYGGADSDRLEGHDGVDVLNGGAWVDLLVLDVDPSYTQNDRPDALDGHGPAAPGIFTDDDNATDILIIEGDQETTTSTAGAVTGNDDHIRLGQNGAGQLVVLYNSRILEATWLDGFSTPLVEQFQVDGLTGDDTLSFITERVDVTGNDGNTLQIRPLDFNGLASRSDFVGVLNGGPGNDHLTGTAVRDRLDGGSGSDILFGYAGDDRLHGGRSGSANDHDISYAGQGNDDLFGGSGSNELLAWTTDPREGQQFGLFVNNNGELVTDNGDLNGDGALDSDATQRPYQPENTGLNRMLGNVYEDDIYGGTGLDFIFGNGGNDRNFRADGTQFASGDGNLGGDTWVDYARNNGGVWYIGGSVREDEISLNYVTEEGVLSGRHVVTRSTTIVDHLGVPRTTFSVSADLDFGATDSSGNLIWNPAGHTWNSETGTFHDDTLTLNQILPPEGSHQSIIIDALGGDDTVIVGETVQGTVWISAGAGNDFVQIKSGNALLPDQTDTGGRNDSLPTAFELKRPALPAVLTGGTLPTDGQLSSDARFTLKINDNAPVEVVIPKAAVNGQDGSFSNENADDLLFDINAALEAAGLISQVMATVDGGVLQFVSTDRGDEAKLLLKTTDGNDPTVSELGFASGVEAIGTSTTSTFQYNDLTVDGVNDEDFYRFTLHEQTGPNATASVNSATDEDGLVTSLYRSVGLGTPELIAVNADAWDRDGESNETAATARVLENVQVLSGISGLTLHAASDVDQFKFTLDQTGVHTDKMIVRHTAGSSDLQLTLTDANGTEVVSATVKDGDPDTQEFLLDGVAAGTYTIRISSASAARYELIPSIGLVGSKVINLNAGSNSQVSLANRDTGVYFLQVSTPNRLPTVYNLGFDLDLAGDTAASAIGLADTSFHVNRRDVITGGEGHDVLIGGLGEDWIFGGEGNDVISGGLDRQASDLLIGGGGSDIFQILPDQLPVLHGSTETYVPTFNDQLDGGEGEDQVLYLGGDTTTHPVTGAQVAIPDFVTLRFNTQLHRYEFTSLRYDVANDRYETTADGTRYAQQYQFFQAINIEETVIDVQAGDDFVRADAEFKFAGNHSEWGIKVGNLEQGATLGDLIIEGRDGDDTLFGGDADDIIDGGAGDDIIVGGLGNDLLFGGGGSDTISGQHAGDQTPTFTADDITFTSLANPAALPADAKAPVYRDLPIASPTALQSRRPEVTVQTNDAQLDHADTLELSDESETIEYVGDIGDFNADGFRDFVVSTNRWHYVFFGPVDLTTLHEIDARANVDANDLASRADILIGIGSGNLVGGVVNINGDVASFGGAINDLVFTSTTWNGMYVSILRGGAALIDRQTTTAWPRTIESVQNIGTPQVHRVWLEGTDVEDIMPLDYDGDGLTDLLVTTTTDGVKTAKLFSGASISRATSAHGATLVTEISLPNLTGQEQQNASIHVAGDLNNDGLDDIVGILAADPALGTTGYAFVHYARPDVPEGVNLPAVYDRLLTDDYLDGGLTRLNDANGDGFNDVLLSRTRTQFPQAIQFTTDTLHLNTPWNTKLSPDTELTVQAWVRADGSGRQAVLRQSSPNAATIGIWITADGEFEIESANANRQTDTVIALPATGPVVVGEWHHVSATVNRNTGVITVYIDGEIAATKSVSTGEIYDSGVQSSVYNGPGVPNLIRQEGDFQVGNVTWAGSQRPSKISVADVRYFARELTPSEIAAGYRVSEIADTSDLVLWYRLLEKSGTMAIDSSGNELHGTYRTGFPIADSVKEPVRIDTTGNPKIRAASALSENDVAIIYGESENVLDLGEARKLDTNIELDPAALDGLQETTIELDFKTSKIGNEVQTLISSLDADSNNEFSVFLHPDNRIEVVDKGQSNFWDIPSDAADDEWHHLTVVRQPSDVTMYIGDRESLTKVTDYKAPLADAPIQNVKRVRVQLNGTNYLHLAEVVIRDAAGNNIALQGTAKQSSTHSVGVASRGNDGNTSGDWGDHSVTHTGKNHHAWWEVELPAEAEVHQIEVFNRTDAASSRLSNFQVIAYDDSKTVVWVREFANVQGASLLALHHDADAADSTYRDISVSGEDGTVRTLEAQANVGDAKSVYVKNGAGHQVNLVAIAGSFNRYRPSSPLNGAVAPNGIWKLYAVTQSGAHERVDGWNLRLETTDEFIDRRWSTSSTKSWVSWHWYGPSWHKKTTVTHHVDSRILEDSLRTMESDFTVSGKVDEFGRVQPINGLDFTIGLVDFAGERGYTSTLISPSGTRVEVGSRTSGFLNDFNGENPNGTWKLSIDTGTTPNVLKPLLTGWELDLFTSGTEVLFDGQSQGTQLTPSRTPSTFSADPLKPRVATGRYIRIEALEAGQTLNIGDVSVLDLHNRHIAVLGSATQSGNSGNHAALGVDTGSTHDSTIAVATADADGKAWWQLDLGRNFDISDVRPMINNNSAFAVGFLTSVVRENGTVDFRDRVDPQQSGIRQRVYDGAIRSQRDLADYSPIADTLEPGIGYDAPDQNTTHTFEGYLDIPHDGEIRFWLNSSTDTKVTIDGQIAVQYSHALRNYDDYRGLGKVSLTAGRHRIFVHSYNTSDDVSMTLEYEMPGMSRREIPISALAAAEPTTVFSIVSPAHSPKTRTLSLELDNVLGDLEHLEVLTSHTGQNVDAHLIAPDGTKFVADRLAGSTTRFTPATLPQLSTLSGTWTLILEGQTDFDLDEFDLILHTTHDGRQYRRHGFAHQQPHAGILNDEFKPLSDSARQTGPIGAVLAGWPISADPFEVNLERFGVDSDALATATFGDTPLLNELRETGVSHSLRLEPLSVESLTLGRDRDTLNGDYQAWQDFHGQLDNVRIWDSALPYSQTLPLSDRAVADFDRTGLQAEFDFNDAESSPGNTVKALSFNNNLATLDHTVLDGRTDFTIELRVNSKPVTDGLSTLVSAAGPQSSNEFLLHLQDDGTIAVEIREEKMVWTPEHRIDDDAWHDIAVVRQTVGINSIVKLYVDGALLGQKSARYGSFMNVSKDGLVLGQEQDKVGGGFDVNQAFYGQMDNVRFWSSVRTQEQIIADSGSDLNTNDSLLAGYYRFDRSGSTLQDASSHKRDGVLGNGFSAPQRVVMSSYRPGQDLPALPEGGGNVLTFDNDAVNLDHTILDGADEFTIELSIRPNPTVDGRIQSLIGTTGGPELVVYLTSDTFVVSYGGHKSTWELPARIDDQYWHDIAIVRKKSTQGYTHNVYIDGVALGEKSLANTAPLSVAPWGLVLGQDQDSIGGAFDANQAYYGQMDNLKIWSNARTEQQIIAGLKAAINPSENHLRGYFKFDGPPTANAVVDYPRIRRSISNEVLDTTTGTVFYDSSIHGGWGISYDGHLEVEHSHSNSPGTVRFGTQESLESVATQVLTLPTGETWASPLTVADIDGNGLDDLIVESLDAAGNITVHLASDFGRSQHNGTFTALVRPDSTKNARLAATSAVDVNGDGIDDLLFTTTDAAGRKSQLPVIWGEYDQTVLPKNFDVAANRSVTGSGDFVVDKGTPETFSFEFKDKEVSEGRGEKWIRFTTLGDGKFDGATYLELSSFVRADLIRDDGSVLAKNFWTLDLSGLAAGTYFLKVTSFALEQNPGFNVTMRVPLAGQTWASTDFDQIFAGEGTDWISGGQFRDVIFANDNDNATDTVIGEPIEFRDVDVFTVPERTFGGQTIPAYNIPLEDLALPAASETNNLVPNAGQRIHLISQEREARTVTGQVFDDQNRNGIRDEGEVGLNNMLVILRSESGKFDQQIMTSNIDLNGDGIIAPATETGWYTFSGLSKVNYQVQKGGQAGWLLTSPGTVDTTVSGKSQATASFGVAEPLPARITGALFDSATRQALHDWTVRLYDADGAMVAETTTSYGSYYFNDIVPGHYRIEREHRDGWGPDSGILGTVQTLFTQTLGLFLDEVDFDTWTPADAIHSHKGLWYAFTEDGRLLQGTTAENAHSGTVVRHLSSLMNPLLSLRDNLKEMQKSFANRAIHVEAISGETTRTSYLYATKLAYRSFSGVVFEDVNGDGIQDDSQDTPLGSVKLNAYNDDDKIVATTITDSNGHYQFDPLPFGIYYVLVESTNWEVTGSDDEVARKSHQIDSELRLTYTGKYFQSWGGQGEKWIYGNEGGTWYYITPNGNLYEWNGSPRHDLSGRHIATLSVDFWAHPERLFEAEHPEAIPFVLSHNYVEGKIGLRRGESTTITGATYFDTDGDGNRAASDYSINGVEVTLLNDAGEIVATTTTQTVDLDSNGEIDLLTENGVYTFEAIKPGTYYARITDVDSVKGDNNEHAAIQIMSPSGEKVDILAQQLNQNLNLQPTNFRPANEGLRNEIWLQGERDVLEYYFILPTGEFVRWDGAATGAPRGETVGMLSSRYYEDTGLLHAAAPLGTVKVRVDDADTKNGPNLGLHPLDSSTLDDIMSNWTVIDE